MQNQTSLRISNQALMIISDLLGVLRDMSQQLLDWSHAMVAMYQFNRSRKIEDEALRAMDEFSDYVRKLATDRTHRPRDDLITALVQSRESGDRLSEAELITTVILLLNAGHEATVHGFGNAIKALLESGQDPQSLFVDDNQTGRSVDEFLRFDPPLHLFRRFVLQDLEIAGLSLSKGQEIGLLLGSANLDGQKYADPEKLDPIRGGEGHVSFGAGTHFCIGAPLARLEMATALPILFKRIPDLSLASQPIYADRYHFHGLERLPVNH